MLEQKVAKVNCEARTFLRELRLDVLIQRELCSKTDGVVAIDSEGRRPEEYLVCFGAWNYCTRLPQTARAFTDQFSKESPVPFVWRSAPLRRTVSVNEAVIEHIRSLTSVVLKESCKRTAEPQIVTE